MTHPETQEMVDAAMRAFEGASERLGLTVAGQTAILGAPETRLDRLALFLAIYEESGNLLGDSDSWLKAANKGSKFEGKAPLDYILEDPGQNLISTLQYLRQAMGGWGN